ncbi:MAG: hypothetical protein NTZ20_01190 [Candidatus Levybacteria bacterium]|nr:hypothetical protein [Candidatus Levybacteria bacterium]MSU26111.1 hypothetical protein [Candidatus Levybacteria bacterium]
MKNIVKKFSANKFLIFASCIVMFAIFLRFYNYENRWGLAYDQAHDAIISKYALDNHKLPLLGPFSSAGPFQTGGEWYWLLMIPLSLYPNSIYSPWIFITIIYVFFVGMCIYVGKQFNGPWFGLLFGFFAAISTAQIAQSVNLTNQSPHAILGLLGILNMIFFVRTKKTKYLFFLSFCIGLSVSIHLQGVALGVLLLITLGITRALNIRNILVIILGGIIPLLSIITYDANNDWFNIRNMFWYYFHDQYKISLDVLGRRWLTFGSIFIPTSWAHVIGGYKVMGYIEIFGIITIFIYLLLKKKITQEILIICISVLGMFIMIRYTRTPLYDSYLVFMHPFILILTSYFIYILYKYNRFISIILFFFIIGATLYRDRLEINGGSNLSAVNSRILIANLIRKYPNESFSIYDKDLRSTDKSLPLVLFLYFEGKISDKGRRIGITTKTDKDVIRFPIITNSDGGYALFDLNRSSNNELNSDRWAFVNPSAIYKSTEEWYHK